MMALERFNGMESNQTESISNGRRNAMDGYNIHSMQQLAKDNK